MPGPFAITPSTSTATLDASRQGTVTFTVKNTTKIRIRGIARFVATPPESVHWYTVAPAPAAPTPPPPPTPTPSPATGQPTPPVPNVRDFGPEETQTYTVNIAVPPSAAAGDYRFKLIVANEANPDDDFTESTEVGFSIAAAPPPPPSKFPIWIIPVILVILALIIGAIVLLTRDTTPPPPVETEVPTEEPTAEPTITPTATPAFAVSRVVTTVSPLSSSTCPTTFTFTAVITGNRAGTVTYTWERSDGASAPVNSVTLNASGQATVTNTWSLSAEGTRWMRLRVLTPNDVASGQATFRLTCPPAIGTIIPGSITSRGITIDNISFSPRPPTTLSLGNDVDITFRYTISAVTAPQGVRIFARPFTNGSLSTGYTASGSTIFTGSGTQTVRFTIQTGAQRVDRIRFQVWNPTQSELLHEFFVVVDYQFR